METVEQVLRELAKIGFSDIRKAVAWRNEMVAREDEEERKGEDGVVRVTQVLLPRLSIVPSDGPRHRRGDCPRFRKAPTARCACGCTTSMRRSSRSASTSACSTTRSKSTPCTASATSRCRLIGLQGTAPLTHQCSPARLVAPCANNRWRLPTSSSLCGPIVRPPYLTLLCQSTHNLLAPVEPVSSWCPISRSQYMGGGGVAPT